MEREVIIRLRKRFDTMCQAYSFLHINTSILTTTTASPHFPGEETEAQRG